MAENTLILGLAAGYHYGDVRPFLMSLDRVGFKGETVLFVSETTRDQDRMAEHARLIPLARKPELEEVPYNGLRYFLYLDYLTSADTTFDRILITDVRDVIFQRAPFSYPWPDGLNCAMEDERVTVGTCPFNAHWVREHLGQHVLDTMADKAISCSGTTVGDHTAMLRYLRAMTDQLVPPTTGERMAGYDQGIHNMLIHTGRINATLHTNAGPILTLAQTETEPELNTEGEVLNQSGHTAHMVHQYDRKPLLFRHIRDRFTK